MKTPKRRIKLNVWGNWNGYLGTRKVEEFGTDGKEAELWLSGGVTTQEMFRKERPKLSLKRS